jgi:hypothetical protein
MIGLVLPLDIACNFTYEFCKYDSNWILYFLNYTVNTFILQSIFLIGYVLVYRVIVSYYNNLLHKYEGVYTKEEIEGVITALNQVKIFTCLICLMLAFNIFHGLIRMFEVSYNWYLPDLYLSIVPKSILEYCMIYGLFQSM